MFELTLMKFDPATGEEKPYPSQVNQYREYHGKIAWLYNPFTGVVRNASDIGSDTFGIAIVPPSSFKLYDPELAKKVTETAKEILSDLSAEVDTREFGTYQTDSYHPVLTLKDHQTPCSLKEQIDLGIIKLKDTSVYCIDVQNTNVNSIFSQSSVKKNPYSGMFLSEVPFNKLRVGMEVVESEFGMSPARGEITDLDSYNFYVYVKYDIGNQHITYCHIHYNADYVKIK